MASHRPNFLFVCDHGVRGGPLDRVALLPWFADRPGWWAAKGVDGHAIRMWPMEGDRRGWDPKWLGPERHHLDEPDPRRFAIEIVCPAPHCSRRPYRSDDDRLQTLLTAITTDERLRGVFTVSADESVIVMTLEALHAAREIASAKYRLTV